MEADANVPEIQAANFLAGRRKFRFRIWIEGCRGDVYLYGDGRVRTYGQACRFIDQAADCLHEIWAKILRLGKNFWPWLSGRIILAPAYLFSRSARLWSKEQSVFPTGTPARRPGRGLGQVHRQKRHGHGRGDQAGRMGRAIADSNMSAFFISPVTLKRQGERFS